MTEPAPVAGERWIDRDGGHYCVPHDYAFPKGDVCHECCVDPGPAIKVTPDGLQDREALAAENELRSVTRTLKRIAEELAEGTGQEQSLGAKYYDTYLKAMRSWHELHSARLQVESDERLIEHDRRMAGLRGSN